VIQETNHALKPSLRLIVEHDGEQFLARCVDFDLVGPGADVDAAIASLIRIYMKNVLVACELGLEPLAQLPAAPAAYADIWRRAVLRAGGVRPVPIPAFSVMRDGQEVSASCFGRVEAALACDHAA